MHRQKYHREDQLSHRTSAGNVLAHKLLQKTTIMRVVFEDEALREVKAGCHYQAEDKPSFLS